MDTRASELLGAGPVRLPRGGFLRLLPGESMWVPAIPVVLAVVLRIYNLGPRNVWCDEVFSLLAADLTRSATARGSGWASSKRRSSKLLGEGR